VARSACPAVGVKTRLDKPAVPHWKIKIIKKGNMVTVINEVVPWGRSYEEYIRMFNLTRDELQLKILGCGDGPAGFNSRMNRQGYTVVSVDPLYKFTALEIKTRIDEVYDLVIEQTRQNQNKFIWDTIGSLEELGKIRMSAMEEFLQDYEAGRTEGRYIAAGLPELPFSDRTFDLAICSHFLFLYSAQLSFEFHRQAVLDLCRVAGEVRIFPLLDMDCRTSPHVSPIIRDLSETGLRVEIQSVPYEFQRGGNRMMKITR
jgi:hypothetical protein